MKEILIRIWKEINVEEVKKHLLLAGELTANCENCQHLGIDFARETTCPNCGTGFKYIGFRRKNSFAEELSAIGRLKEKRPDLVIVDYEDIKRATGKSRAHDIFRQE